MDEPKLNTTRLHRVLRNLCYHTPTRTWIIRALLSVLQRTGDCHLVEGHCSSIMEGSVLVGRGSCDSRTLQRPAKKSSSGSSQQTTSGPSSGSSLSSGSSSSQVDILNTPSRPPPVDLRLGLQPSWLSISLDAALGSRANVFQMHRGHGKKTPANTAVNIHPQAAPVVCRNVLDTLISLAKSFPSQFLPQTKAKEAAACAESEQDKAKDMAQSKPVGSKPTDSAKVDSSSSSKVPDLEFWDLLVRLDGITSGKKGKSFHYHHQRQQSTSETDTPVMSFDASPLGQLMSMLAHPVLRRSQLLTDRLLRLLGLVSMGLQEINQPSTSSNTTTTSTVVPSANSTATNNLVPSSTSLSSGEIFQILTFGRALHRTFYSLCTQNPGV